MRVESSRASTGMSRFTFRHSFAVWSLSLLLSFQVLPEHGRAWQPRSMLPVQWQLHDLCHRAEGTQLVNTRTETTVGERAAGDDTTTGTPDQLFVVVYDLCSSSFFPSGYCNSNSQCRQGSAYGMNTSQPSPCGITSWVPPALPGGVMCTAATGTSIVAMDACASASYQSCASCLANTNCAWVSQ